jgi:hypothetical protein
MTACISRYDDPAALGEADIRARALGAGWRNDTAGRLICPYCQRRCPGLQAASPVAWRDNTPADGPTPQAGYSRVGGISAVWATLSASQRRLLGGQDLPPRWASPGSARDHSARDATAPPNCPRSPNHAAWSTCTPGAREEPPLGAGSGHWCSSAEACRSGRSGVPQHLRGEVLPNRLQHDG